MGALAREFEGLMGLLIKLFLMYIFNVSNSPRLKI